jgi:protein gp37
MAGNSKIEWTDTTWNPLAGCTRASEGCDNCYAAVMALRLDAMARADIEAGRDPGAKAKYIGTAVRTASGRVAFNGTINLDEAALDEPYRWKKRRRVFVNSMSDLFHKDVHPGFIYQVFKVMAATPQHTYQVLTKRPENIMPAMRLYGIGGATPRAEPWPGNVQIGTSIENQKAADERIRHLVKVPAKVRFLSCEPLIGPVDLTHHLGGGYVRWHEDGRMTPANVTHKPLHWVIVGGESGSRARPMHPDWARSLRDQCQAAGVAYHFKQWGERIPYERSDGYVWHSQHGDVWQQDGESFQDKGLTLHHTALAFRRVGKHAAGRLLDGRTWDELPGDALGAATSRAAG